MQLQESSGSSELEGAAAVRSTLMLRSESRRSRASDDGKHTSPVITLSLTTKCIFCSTVFFSNFVRSTVRVATGAVAGVRPATDLEREFGAALRDRGDTAQDTVRLCHDVMDC